MVESRPSSHLLLLTCLVSLLLSPQPGRAQNLYSIDSDDSVLRIFVGRAGLLARMGHNHVVHTRDLSGEVSLAANPIESHASLSFNAMSLVVDDPDERARAGEGYESEPGESAVAGTRENMLGEDVLNAEAWPTITIDARPVSISGPEWLLEVTIDFQGSSFTQQIPARINYDSSSLTAEADFSLNHEDLGLEVFTAIGGALRVAEELDFELDLSASIQ